jgi:hypothetical protein
VPPEGHVLRFDAAGRIIGPTIINAKWLLERDGELVVTPQLRADQILEDTMSEPVEGSVSED